MRTSSLHRTTWLTLGTILTALLALGVPTTASAEHGDHGGGGHGGGGGGWHGGGDHGFRGGRGVDGGPGHMGGGHWDPRFAAHGDWGHHGFESGWGGRHGWAGDPGVHGAWAFHHDWGWHGGGWGWRDGGWGWHAAWGWNRGWAWNGVILAGGPFALAVTPPVFLAPLPIFVAPPPIVAAIPYSVPPPPIVAAAPHHHRHLHRSSQPRHRHRHRHRWRSRPSSCWSPRRHRPSWCCRRPRSSWRPRHRCSWSHHPPSPSPSHLRDWRSSPSTLAAGLPARGAGTAAGVAMEIRAGMAGAVAASLPRGRRGMSGAPRAGKVTAAGRRMAPTASARAGMATAHRVRALTVVAVVAAGVENSTKPGVHRLQEVAAASSMATVSAVRGTGIDGPHSNQRSDCSRDAVAAAGRRGSVGAASAARKHCPCPGTADPGSCG